MRVFDVVAAAYEFAIVRYELGDVDWKLGLEAALAKSPGRTRVRAPRT